MIKTTMLVVLTLSTIICTQGQNTKFSIDLGGGYSDTEIAVPGSNIDGQFTYIYKRWHLGPYLQTMNAFDQINSPGEVVLYFIEDVPPETNPWGDNFSRNWKVSQTHIGLLLGFDVIQSTRLRLNLSAGYGYSMYREVKFDENYLDPRWPHLTLFTRNVNKFDFSYGLAASYDVYKTLFVGARTRYVNGITTAISYNFFVGIRI